MTHESKTSLKNNILMSSASAGIAEMITLPIDTIKVNIQSLQPRKISVRESAGFIWEKQGIRGFYQAWIPSLLRQTSYTGIRLGLYDNLKTKYPCQTMPQQIIQGGFCGLIGNIAAMPFDVTKTKMQRRSHKLLHTSTFVKSIWQKDGFFGFYKGMRQTAQRSMLISGIQLPTYFTLQEKFSKVPYLQDNTFLRTTAASIATTTIVTSSVYPVDLCKSIVMSRNRNPSPETKTTTTKIMKELVQKDGFFALYRGTSMGIARAIPHFLLTSLCYEQLKKKFT